MTAFYQALQTGQSKTAAVRQAQLALIENDQDILAQTQRGIGVVAVGVAIAARNSPVPSAIPIIGRLSFSLAMAKPDLPRFRPEFDQFQPRASGGQTGERKDSHLR
jgi:CHAT domain-containing protein